MAQYFQVLFDNIGFVILSFLVIRLTVAYAKHGIRGVLDRIYLIAIMAVCFVVLQLTVIGLIFAWFFSSKTCWRGLVGIDQTANASLGGVLNFVFGVKDGDPRFGNEDETVSSVLGKLFVRDAGNKFARFIYFFLDHIQENHCLMSIETDEGSGVVKEEFVPTVAEKAAIADYRERNPKSILSDIGILYALGLRGDDENE